MCFSGHTNQQWLWPATHEELLERSLWKRPWACRNLDTILEVPWIINKLFFFFFCRRQNTYILHNIAFEMIYQLKHSVFTKYNRAQLIKMEKIQLSIFLPHIFNACYQTIHFVFTSTRFTIKRWFFVDKRQLRKSWD